MTLRTTPIVDALSGAAAESAQMAITAGLVYVTDRQPGLRRLRAGRGFKYVDARNQPVAAERELKRIASLAVPPAYRDVWNNSFGLTTLRNRHVRFIPDGRALLNFRGKGGVPHEVLIDDARIVQIVRRCKELRGQHLFQYVTDAGERCPVDSGQVNDYLHAIMGADFTAKDFRTWSATLHAMTLLSRTPLPVPSSERAFKRTIVAVVRQVAERLRNTPAVCRKSYINPAVFDMWRSGALLRSPEGQTKAPARTERAMLALLRR